MRKVTFLFSILFIGNFGFAQSIDTVKPPQYSSPSWIGFRSTIIPGWGQMVNQKPFKAAVIIASSVSLGAGIYLQDLRRLDANEKKQNSLNVSEKNDYARLEKFYENDRNKLIWWFVGLTLLSTFDAYVDAHLANFEVEPVVTPKNEIGLRINIPLGIR